MKAHLILVFLIISFAGLSQMTEREQNVLDEINLCRTNPKLYMQ